jgi:23S rRNA (uridine2552-2'-O)-methyltransferase
VNQKGKGGASRGKGDKGRKGGRNVFTRVKTAKGRKLSSTRWLQRQLNDPYVAKAKRFGYPSRAAFKLIELDDRFHFLSPGRRIIDLGAAPGGWTRVAVERSHSKPGEKASVIALDVCEMDPVPGAHIICCDFLDGGTPELLKEALNGPVDVVLSDMAAPATGHGKTDHLRIVMLCEAALDFATEVLSPEGTFVAKVLQGGAEGDLLARMKRLFASVRHAKPPASRTDSAEIYVVATGFRG